MCSREGNVSGPFQALETSIHKLDSIARSLVEIQTTNRVSDIDLHDTVRLSLRLTEEASEQASNSEREIIGD